MFSDILTKLVSFPFIDKLNKFTSHKLLHKSSKMVTEKPPKKTDRKFFTAFNRGFTVKKSKSFFDNIFEAFGFHLYIYMFYVLN